MENGGKAELNISDLQKHFKRLWKPMMEEIVQESYPR